MSRWLPPLPRRLAGSRNLARRAGTGLAGLSLALGLALPAKAGSAAPLAVPTSGSVAASYAIGLNGITIGRLTLDAALDRSNYTLALRGMTSGLSRLVSDGTGYLASTGNIADGIARPNGYILRTTENGRLSSLVAMRLRAGTIMAVTALPLLPVKPDRVPLLPRHKQQIVDPLSAMIAPLYPADMGRACNRTIPVFDGWYRFDIRLFYKSTAEVKGEDGSYSGPVSVCGARYVAVAGHRPSRAEVKFMEQNTDLEVWLAPAEAVGLMLPYRIVIGTQIGILTVHASHFLAHAGGTHDERAAAN